MHAADTITAELQVPAIVWDGGGADSNWTTPENWSTDTVPTLFDSVLFDGTSIKDCVVNTPVSVINFTILSGYTGVINGTFRNYEIGGNFIQAGGDLRASSMSIDGTWSRTIGTLNVSTLSFTGTDAPASALGPGMTISSLIIAAGDPITWLEPLSVSSSFTITDRNFNIGNASTPLDFTASFHVSIRLIIGKYCW